MHPPVKEWLEDASRVDVGADAQEGPKKWGSSSAIGWLDVTMQKSTSHETIAESMLIINRRYGGFNVDIALRYPEMILHLESLV